MSDREFADYMRAKRRKRVVREADPTEEALPKRISEVHIGQRSDYAATMLANMLAIRDVLPNSSVRHIRVGGEGTMRTLGLSRGTCKIDTGHYQCTLEISLASAAEHYANPTCLATWEPQSIGLNTCAFHEFAAGSLTPLEWLRKKTRARSTLPVFTPWVGPAEVELYRVTLPGFMQPDGFHTYFRSLQVDTQSGTDRVTLYLRPINNRNYRGNHKDSAAVSGVALDLPNELRAPF